MTRRSLAQGSSSLPQLALVLVSLLSAVTEIASRLAVSALARRREVSTPAAQAFAALGGAALALAIVAWARRRKLRPLPLAGILVVPVALTGVLGFRAPALLVFSARWCQLVGPMVAPLFIIGCLDAASARRWIPLAAAGSIAGKLTWSFAGWSPSRVDIRALVALAVLVFIVAVLGMGAALRPQPSPFTSSRDPVPLAMRPAAALLVVGLLGFAASAWLSPFAPYGTEWQVLAVIAAVIVSLAALSRTRLLPIAMMVLLPTAVVMHLLRLGHAAALFGLLAAALFGVALLMEVAASGARREGALVVAILYLVISPIAALAG